MKGYELINLLREYPRDKEVVIRDADTRYSLLRIQELEIHPEYLALAGDFSGYYRPVDNKRYLEDHYETRKIG